jgi:hypothetical protein
MNLSTWIPCFDYGTNISYIRAYLVMFTISNQHIIYVWASGGHFCWYSLACKDECPPLAFAMLVGTEPQWKKWYVATWWSRSGQTIRKAKQATGLQIACGSIVALKISPLFWGCRVRRISISTLSICPGCVTEQLTTWDIMEILLV